ncbi:glycine zipper 2TM domain-containing protein [Trinickia symbiotica]|nr:glycine zipper 2TM domain-containing protein [Trinickia symbiotica]
METTTQQSNRIHPLVATAAGAVIVASAVAVAAMTGILPKAHGNDNPSAQAVIAQAASASAPAALPVQQGAVQVESRAPTRPRVATRPARAEPRYMGEGQQQAAVDRNVGTVEAITPVTQQGHGTGIGAVGGAVAGGLLGNQIGRGNGRTAATIIGALGGGVAGNVVEQHLRSETDYEVSVRMGDGSVRTMTYHQQPNLAVGQRVRVDGDTIVGAV